MKNTGTATAEQSLCHFHCNAFLELLLQKHWNEVLSCTFPQVTAAIAQISELFELGLLDSTHLNQTQTSSILLKLILSLQYLSCSQQHTISAKENKVVSLAQVSLNNYFWWPHNKQAAHTMQTQSELTKQAAHAPTTTTTTISQLPLLLPPTSSLSSPLTLTLGEWLLLLCNLMYHRL